MARTSEPYVAVVNPDAYVEPGATKVLVDVLESQPDVGMATPRILTPDGRVYESVRSFPSIADALGHAVLHYMWPTNPCSRRYKLLDWDRAAAADVEWVAGTCFVVRRTAWDQVGGFDEDFFMYMEDVDLCRRLAGAGWRLRYVPEATVVHEIGRSSDQTPYRMIVAHHRSIYRYVDKTWTGSKRWLLPLVAAGLAARTVVGWAHRRLRGRPPAAP
jgi:N-acetylglucosaminyl-diphospho-decaprenol L-rhamnosyltransferase